MKSSNSQYLKLFFLMVGILSVNPSLRADSFYANADIQNLRPAGFAVQTQSSLFVNLIKKFSLKEANKLIRRIRSNEQLYLDLQNYALLTPMEQVPLLKAVFTEEVESMGIVAPKLVIDLNYPRGAFFEFDIDSTDPGTVYINPAKTYSDNPIMSLSLLIHETRHSLQLQMAQAGNVSGMRGPVAAAYYNAFKAQGELQGKLSFCDFLTLNNEYEAFLFGNYIIHNLFEGSVDMISMGTYASQFNERGELKIDLDHLHKHSKNALEDFNLLQLEQAEALGL